MNVWVAVAWPDGMVRSNDEGMAVNPTRLDAPEPATLTAIVLSAPKRVVPCTVAVTVTVVAPAFSASVCGDTDRSTALGAPSSSTTVSTTSRTVTGVAPPICGAVMVNRVLASSRLSSVGVTVNVVLADRAPAGISNGA